MIKITRKEQQILSKLRTVIAAQKAETFTEEMLLNIDPDYSTIQTLVEKAVLDTEAGTITKEQLQVMDEDPGVEQAWEDFRAVQGDGSMTKLYTPNKAAEKAGKHLEEVLFKKGRLTHMVNSDTHIWVTEDKVEFWKSKGYKEACPTAMPLDLQA